MNKIDTQLSKCFLLSTSFYLVEANMQNNIIVPPFWFCLEAYSYPAMTFVTLSKINRSNRIGIGKEELIRIFFSWQTFFQELDLMTEHFL